MVPVRLWTFSCCLKKHKQSVLFNIHYPFCGAFGMKGIVEFLKIAIILWILFGLCCNTQLLGGVRITPNTFVIIAFLWFSTFGRPSFFSFVWGGPSCPLPLGCSLLFYEYTCLLWKKKENKNQILNFLFIGTRKQFH